MACEVEIRFFKSRRVLGFSVLKCFPVFPKILPKQFSKIYSERSVCYERQQGFS